MSHDIEQQFHSTIKWLNLHDQKKQQTKLQSSALVSEQFPNSNSKCVLGFNTKNIASFTTSTSTHQVKLELVEEKVMAC